MMEKIIEIIYTFLNNPSVITILVIIRLIFGIVSLVVIGFVIFVLLKTSLLSRYFGTDIKEIITYKPFGSKKIEKQWKLIKERLTTGLESEFKLAIIEADFLLETILIKMGLVGKNLPEKLDNLTPIFLSNLEDVKEVNRIRNNIIHDPDYRLTSDKAKELLSVYEEALKNLQVL